MLTKRFLVNSMLGLFLALTFVAVGAHSEEEWLQLFNGEDLDDWLIKFRGEEAGVNYLDTFRVEDGALKVCYDKYESFKGNFGHIFYKQPFSHYRLRVEYRFTGEQVAGGPGWAFRNKEIQGKYRDRLRISRGLTFLMLCDTIYAR